MPKIYQLVLCFLNENKLLNNEDYQLSKRKNMKNDILVIDQSTCNIYWD